jgi:hypothetical protein
MTDVSADGAAETPDGGAPGGGEPAQPAEGKRPAFTGLAIYRDLRLRFSLLVEV